MNVFRVLLPSSLPDFHDSINEWQFWYRQTKLQHVYVLCIVCFFFCLCRYSILFIHLFVSFFCLVRSLFSSVCFTQSQEIFIDLCTQTQYIHAITGDWFIVTNQLWDEAVANIVVIIHCKCLFKYQQYQRFHLWQFLCTQQPKICFDVTVSDGFFFPFNFVWVVFFSFKNDTLEIVYEIKTIYIEIGRASVRILFVCFKKCVSRLLWMCVCVFAFLPPKSVFALYFSTKKKENVGFPLSTVMLLPLCLCLCLCLYICFRRMIPFNILTKFRSILIFIILLERKTHRHFAWFIMNGLAKAESKYYGNEKGKQTNYEWTQIERKTKRNPILFGNRFGAKSNLSGQCTYQSNQNHFCGKSTSVDFPFSFLLSIRCVRSSFSYPTFNSPISMYGLSEWTRWKESHCFSPTRAHNSAPSFSYLFLYKSMRLSTKFYQNNGIGYHTCVMCICSNVKSLLTL